MVELKNTFAELALEALGTKCHIIFADFTNSAISEATDLVKSQLERYDLIFSVHRSDSEATRVNIASSSTMAVSDEFALLVSLYKEKYVASDHKIDLTAGFDLLDLYRRFNPLVEEACNKDFFRRIDFSDVSVVLASDDSSAQLSRPVGAFLDFGGLGKAFIADRIASTLVASFSGGVLVNLGGDISTAGVVPYGGWNVKVTDDFSLDTAASGGSVRIFGGGIATSSIVTRTWDDSSGSKRLHIVGEGLKKSSIATVTAVGLSAFEANYYSLASLLMGDNAVPFLIKSRVPSLVRSLDGRGLAVSGWPMKSEDSENNLIGVN